MRRSWLRLFWAGVIVAGCAVAYLVWSGIGERLLHQEIETQLGRLLEAPVEIEKVELRLTEGLSVEARGLSAYPSSSPDTPPALRASRVVAWIDFVALLVGRLELSTLILESPHLRIERAADGSFPDLPIPGVPAGATLPNDLALPERIARLIEGLDPAADAFASEFRVADRIEVSDGTLRWIDRGALSKDGAPLELRLELIGGIAHRDWLAGKIDLEVRAVFVDGQHAPFPVEVEVHRDDEPHFEWLATLSQVPLELAEEPLQAIRTLDDLVGTLDAKLQIKTAPSGSRMLDFQGVISDASVTLLPKGSTVEQEHVELRANIDLSTKRLRISEGWLTGQRLGLSFKTTIDRPLRTGSRARLESRMVGVKVSDLFALSTRFEDQTDLAVALSRFTERIESGQIRYVEAAGTARIREWQDLISGESQEFPDGFLFGGAVADVTIGTGTDDQIEELTGVLEWTEDQVSLRRMTGIYNGRPLPEMNGVIQGVAHLIRAPDSERVLTGNYATIPGLQPMLEIFKPRDPDRPPPVKAIGLAIDRLDHPILRWPIRDMRVLVEPLQNGMEVHIREGRWSGASVSGDLVWLDNEARPTIDAHVLIGPPPIPPAEASAAPGPESNADVVQAPRADRWGEGRFEMQFRPSPTLPFERAVGFFRLDGIQLVGHEVEITLEPQGKAALHPVIDLSDPDSIGLDLSFAITDATMEGMSEFVALPPDLVTGGVGATGTLSGRVRPDTNFIAELTGRARVEVASGRIGMELPLMLRLGKASEGYNPFSNADALDYESIKTTIQLDNGTLSTEDFEIEGPLRVFANASLDTMASPPDIRAVVGIFLFRTSGEILGNFPLVRSFLPGSDRGLIGAYFEVDGPIDDADVDALPMKTLMSAVPSAITAPFKVLGLLFGRSDEES